MSTTDQTGSNFAARLFEQLLPFQTLDTLGHLWALCDGIYAMFQNVETLTTERDDGLHGWANMVDINVIPSQYLPYLAQFVGAEVKPGLSDADQRAYIMSLPGFNRGRPATIIAAVQTTLTGTKFVSLQERQWVDTGGVWHDNAWRYTIITKPSETPNVNATLSAIRSQKPGPDQFFYAGIEGISYEWLAAEYNSYTELQAAYPSYQAMRDAQIT